MKQFIKAKSNYLVIFIITIMLILTGCQSNFSPTQDEEKLEQSESIENVEKQTEKATIILSENDGGNILNKEEINFKKNAILMDVMKENFEVESDEKETFIEGLNGVKAKKGEQKAWIYSVNGETASVGVSEYKLKDGDKVEFDFQEWE